MTTRREWLQGLLIVALLIAGFALKGVLLIPPAPRTPIAGEFDSQRALARLQRILGDERAHPVDSAADDMVRDRLIAELRAIGLQAQVQEATDCSAMPKDRVVSCSHVRNVIATIAGRGPGKHLLLNAHYDSTPTGPGAADDGLGVATLLEVAAILQKSPPPRPVTLLFNEGEEFGLNGASAFVRNNPLAREVNSLINIDVRGVTGPVLMHETSDPNGTAMSIYASATRRPYANSISTDFARLIPNTTDVVFFKPQGWTLLNYGIIGNETRYHSPGDTVDALDRASLAQMGSEVLAATRVLAAIPDPAQAGSGRTVFTDLAGRAFIRLPLLVAAAALATLLLAALALAWRRKALGRPLLVAAAMVAGGSVAAAAVSIAAGLIRAGDYWRAHPLVPYLGVYAVLLAAMLAIWRRWGGVIGRDRMRAAAWLLILLLGGAISVALPGATIFFLIAPALALAGIALDKRAPAAASALAIAALLTQFLMVAELLALIEMLLIDGPLWAGAPLAAIAVLPVLIEAEPERFRPAFGALLILALGLWVAALLMPRSSSERPLAFSIDYFRDSDSPSAKWGVASKQAPLPADFPGRWHKGELPYNARTRWIADAPAVETAIPEARVVSAEPVGNGRRLRLRLSPGAGANNVSIRFAEGTRLTALGLAGSPVAVPLKGKPAKALLRCSGRSCEGLVIEAVFADRKPIEAELFGTRFGLPPLGQELAAKRPRNAIPQYSPDQTITLAHITL